MKKRPFLSIIVKELVEAKRTTGIYILTTFLYSGMLQWFIVRNYVAMAREGKLVEQMGETWTNETFLSMAAGFSLIYVAPMVLPFFANAILSRSFIEERAKQALMPLLATGTSPGLVWTAKLLSAFLFSYPVTLACVALDVVMIRFWFGLDIPTAPHVWVTALVVTPLVSVGVLALMSLLFWTVRHANIVASILPVVLSLGLWSQVSAKPMTSVVFYVVLLALGGAALTIAVCALIINRLSRQFIVGL